MNIDANEESNKVRGETAMPSTPRLAHNPNMAGGEMNSRRERYSDRSTFEPYPTSAARASVQSEEDRNMSLSQRMRMKQAERECENLENNSGRASRHDLRRGLMASSNTSSMVAATPQSETPATASLPDRATSALQPTTSDTPSSKAGTATSGTVTIFEVKRKAQETVAAFKRMKQARLAREAEYERQSANNRHLPMQRALLQTLDESENQTASRSRVTSSTAVLAEANTSGPSILTQHEIGQQTVDALKEQISTLTISGDTEIPVGNGPSSFKYPTVKDYLDRQNMLLAAEAKREEMKAMQLGSANTREPVTDNLDQPHMTYNQIREKAKQRQSVPGHAAKGSPEFDYNDYNQMDRKLNRFFEMEKRLLELERAEHGDLNLGSSSLGLESVSLSPDKKAGEIKSSGEKGKGKAKETDEEGDWILTDGEGAEDKEWDMCAEGDKWLSLGSGAKKTFNQKQTDFYRSWSERQRKLTEGGYIGNGEKAVERRKEDNSLLDEMVLAMDEMVVRKEKMIKDNAERELEKVGQEKMENAKKQSDGKELRRQNIDWMMKEIEKEGGEGSDEGW